MRRKWCSWWWFQPLWRICSSGLTISPGTVGVKILKIFELPPSSINILDSWPTATSPKSDEKATQKGAINHKSAHMPGETLLDLRSQTTSKLFNKSTWNTPIPKAHWSARCLSFWALQFCLRPCVTICRDVHTSNATTATTPSPTLEFNGSTSLFFQLYRSFRSYQVCQVIDPMFQNSWLWFSSVVAVLRLNVVVLPKFLDICFQMFPVSRQHHQLLAPSTRKSNQRSLYHLPHLHLHTALRGKLHQALGCWCWNGRVHRHVLCFENSQNQPVESGTCYICYLVFWKELGFKKKPLNPHQRDPGFFTNLDNSPMEKNVGDMTWPILTSRNPRAMPEWLEGLQSLLSPK